ncbi:MAG: hypothetical protein WD187_03300 [Candidatus Woykebacteria bacterium]
MENTKRLISASEVISQTYSLISKGFGAFLLISVIYGVLQAPVLILVSDQFSNTVSVIISITVTLINVLLLQPLFGGVVVWSVLKLSKGEKPNLNESFNIALQRFPKLLAVTILQIIFIVLGLVLFVIPGIVFGVWFFAADYLVVEKNLGPWKALMESKELVKGNFFGVFLLGLIILAFLVVLFAISQFILINIENFKVSIDSVGLTLSSLVAIVYGFVVYKSLLNLRSE